MMLLDPCLVVHVKVQDLRERANIPSYNAITVRAIAMEAWKAFHSSDGPNGSRNPLGKQIFPTTTHCDITRSSRSVKEGVIPLPLPSKPNTYVWNASTIWNSSSALREASTKNEASKIAKGLARSAPV